MRFFLDFRLKIFFFQNKNIYSIIFLEVHKDNGFKSVNIHSSFDLHNDWYWCSGNDYKYLPLYPLYEKYAGCSVFK